MKLNKNINKAVVIRSGSMRSYIACDFAEGYEQRIY